MSLHTTCAFVLLAAFILEANWNLMCSWDRQHIHCNGAWTSQTQFSSGSEEPREDGLSHHGWWGWENRACFTMCPKATLVLDVEPSTYNVLALSTGEQRGKVSWAFQGYWDGSDLLLQVTRPPAGPSGLCTCFHTAGHTPLHPLKWWIHPTNAYCVSGADLGSRKAAVTESSLNSYVPRASPAVTTVMLERYDSSDLQLPAFLLLFLPYFLSPSLFFIPFYSFLYLPLSSAKECVW